jgi:ectoine hydroxylase-related dioxygenase (phytanoyl-CoA dioxygenase family)
MALSPLTHQPTVSLSPDDIAFFQENGFLRFSQLSTPDEISMMRQSYDRIFQTRAGREEGNQFDLAGSDEEDKEAALPQILGPEKYAPELWDTLARANALQICRQLLGEDMQAQGSHAIFKPAHHGAVTPWHQDEAYWNPDMEYRSISVWVPLQDVDVENGCMQFIPGSHKWEVIAHQPINNDPRIHGLELSPDVRHLALNPVVCPLMAGGATFHPGRTLHYAAANHSPRPRRALIMGFGAPARQRSDLGLPSRRFVWNDIKKPAREERAARAQEKAQAE